MPLLDWLNKDEAVNAAQNVPYRLLEAVPELSYGDETSSNMLIQGDNLDALKALLPHYSGKVKCVYVDPPFNTEQAFEHYDDNLEHSVWLSTMYPRFELLRELVSEDGSIFIHIDDNQLGYLIVVLDEIFGRKNRTYVVAFKQGSATGHKAINPGMVNTCNFLVCYAKNKEKWLPNRIFTPRERDKRYGQVIENYDEHYSNWTLHPLSIAFSEEHGKTTKELKAQFGEKFETKMNEFVISNAHRVVQPVRPDYSNVGKDVKNAIDQSKKEENQVILLKRKEHPDMYLKGGQRWIFYKNKLKNIDGKVVAGEPLTTLWTDILSNNIHNEGGVKFPKGKKPENLIKRVIELSTDKHDIVLDSFLGSGTTAAVAHKMDRQFIGVEMGNHAVSHCVPRLKSVVDGDQGGISKSVDWTGGGGFNFYRLGDAVFNKVGSIRPDIAFQSLANFVWYLETQSPLMQEIDSPLLGTHNGIAYYLLYNGILGDKRPKGGNVLTSNILASLPSHDGAKVIYGETTRFGTARLEAENIIFKQIPYDVRMR